MGIQVSDRILMIRPNAFGSNPQTILDNTFQNSLSPEDSATDIRLKARDEFDSVTNKLKAHNISVCIFEDSEVPAKPDAVFPNNWFSTHDTGILISYPMYSVLRRAERRQDIIDFLEKEYGYSKRYSFEYLEAEGVFLEGTGSMVLDRKNKIIYASLSQRTDIDALEKFALLLNYRTITFNAKDVKSSAVYHTNVLMSIGENYTVLCTESITNAEERQIVLDSIQKSGRKLVEISFDQMASFCGNIIQLRSSDAQFYTIMSDTAFNNFRPDQLTQIKKSGDIIQCSIPHIESFGGGSIRCMIAELF